MIIWDAVRLDDYPQRITTLREVVQENVLRPARVISIPLKEKEFLAHYWVLVSSFSSKDFTFIWASPEGPGVGAGSASGFLALSAQACWGFGVSTVTTEGIEEAEAGWAGGCAGRSPAAAGRPFLFWGAHWELPITCSAFLPRSVHTGHLGGEEQFLATWPGSPHR